MTSISRFETGPQPDDESEADREIRAKEEQLSLDLDELAQREPDPLAPIGDQLGYAAEASLVLLEAQEIARLHKRREDG